MQPVPSQTLLNGVQKSWAQKKPPARKLRMGVSVTFLTLSHHTADRPAFFYRAFLSRQQRSAKESAEPSSARRWMIFTYFRTGPVNRNDLTTMLFGCTPTGIMVSREYSVGSSL